MVFDISEKLSDFVSNKAPIDLIFTEYYLNFWSIMGIHFRPLLFLFLLFGLLQRCLKIRR